MLFMCSCSVKENLELENLSDGTGDEGAGFNVLIEL
jgi:hypothetical protein